MRIALADVLAERERIPDAIAVLEAAPEPDRDVWLRLAELMSLSRQSRLPLVAAGDVHYHVPGRMVLHDVLVAIRHGTTVPGAGEQRFTNAERHLRDVAQIAAMYARLPAALERTLEIAARCQLPSVSSCNCSIHTSSAWGGSSVMRIR